MDEEVFFSELQKDMLKEAFNIGIGSAANALSKMINQEVVLSVPDVELHSSEALLDMTVEHDSIVSIVQKIEEPFDGKSILLFPEESSLEVVRRMLHMEDGSDVQSLLHEEAVTEIGNIILNACVGAVSKTLSKEIKMEIPEFSLARQKNLLEAYELDRKDIMLVINMNMSLQDSDISGYLVFIFGYNALRGLRNAVHDTLTGFTG